MLLIPLTPSPKSCRRVRAQINSPLGLYLLTNGINFAISEEMAEEKRLDWIATFELWDRKKTGNLPLSDITVLIKCLGGNPTAKELSKISDQYGASNVNMDQFISIMAWIDAEEQLKSDVLKAFKSLDVDENGFIHKDDLKKKLMSLGKRPFTETEFDSFIGDITPTQEGEIDLILLTRTIMAKAIN